MSQLIVAAMQPYFLPYIGYFQLAASSDLFLIRDTLQFSKGGWINRNLILTGGTPGWLTLPLARASDFDAINEREISPAFNAPKTLALLRDNYGASPYWAESQDALERIFHYPSRNLSEYVSNSILTLLDFLEIDTSVIFESSLRPIRSGSSSEERLISRLIELNCEIYVNLPGGRALYNPHNFSNAGLELRFLSSEFSKALMEQPKLSIIHNLLSEGKKRTLDNIKRGYSLLP